MIKKLFTGRQLFVTLLVLIGAALLCRLGIWQLDRLAQRHAQNALIDSRMAAPSLSLTGAIDAPDALEYRRVTVRGVYDMSQEVLLRNRALDGMPGVHLITPLRLSGSNVAVLVDRGWVPLAQSTPQERRAFAVPGEVVLQGIARLSQENTAGPTDPPFGPDRPRLDAWFHVNIPRIQQQVGYSLLPVFIEQQPTPDDPPLPRREATTDLGEGPHLSYALQWFSFAVILLGGYVMMMVQRERGRVTAASSQTG